MKTKIYTPRFIEVYFDGGEGITIQCARYVHCYDCSKQAARDFAQLVKGTDIQNWEGNEPEMRVTYGPRLTRDHILSRMQIIISEDERGPVEEFYAHLREFFKEIN